MLLSLINLFKKENKENRFMFLYSSEDSSNNSLNDINDKNNIITNKIIFNEYFDILFDTRYNPEYFYINNKIIYEKNSDSNKNEWIKLEEEIKKIQNYISLNKSITFDNNNVSLFNDILSNDSRNYNKLITIFEKYNKNDKILKKKLFT